MITLMTPMMMTMMVMMMVMMMMIEREWYDPQCSVSPCCFLSVAVEALTTNHHQHKSTVVIILNHD